MAGKILFINDCGLQANAIGKNSKAAREFLEKNYSEAAVTTQEGTIKLAVKALFEVVQTGAKHMELGIMKRRSDCKPGESIAEWKVVWFTCLYAYLARKICELHRS